MNIFVQKKKKNPKELLKAQEFHNAAISGKD